MNKFAVVSTIALKLLLTTRNSRAIVVALSVAALLVAGPRTAWAATVYVSNDGSHTSPFDTWQKAATNINEAVLLATDQTLNVMVSNGVYRLTNELAVSTGITVQSLNGPDETTIYRDAAYGNFRIFNVSHASAVVSGLMMTNGYITSGSGGGLLLTAGTVTNCAIVACSRASGAGGVVTASAGLFTGSVISNNTAFHGVLNISGTAIVEDTVVISNTGGDNGVVNLSGGIMRRCRIQGNTGLTWGSGGVRINGGRLENSLISNNTQGSNSGANNRGAITVVGGSPVIVNCTVAGNTRHGLHRTGGTPAITNSIFYGNGDGTPGANYNSDASYLWYSCAPELTAGVQGNIIDNPQFAGATTGDFRLSVGSPAIDSGTNVWTSADLDLDRASRLQGSKVDMGAYEFDPSSVPFTVAFNVTPAAGVGSVTGVVTAVLAGGTPDAVWWGWDFDDDGVYDLTGADLAVATNVFDLGLHSIAVTVSNSVGETASTTNLNAMVVVAPDIYVSKNGNSIAPYVSWADAATNLNDAVDIAQVGCTVHVADGSYQVSRKLDIFSGFTVRSVNGPELTTVWRDSTAGNFGMFDIRDSNARVTGFTLTNGAAVANSVFFMTEGRIDNCVITNNNIGFGNRYLVTMQGGVMSNCVVEGNHAFYGLAGVSYDGVIEDTVFANNSAGEYGIIVVGASGAGGTLRRCRIHGNYSSYDIGVTLSSGTMENCLVYSNWTTHASSGYGAGVTLGNGHILNCTITANTKAGSGSGVLRTGSGTVTNSIIYGNGIGDPGDNYSGDIAAVWYSSAPELTPSVQGNINADPLFTDAQYRISIISPCIGTGFYDPSWMDGTVDLDGNPRVRTSSWAGKVDMGCYQIELSPRGTLILAR